MGAPHHSPVRILHVAPSVARSYGGPTQSLVGYVEAAQRRGARCTIAAPRCSDDDREWLTGALPGVDCHLFDTAGAGAFIHSRTLLRWLGAHQGAFDVLHIHGTLNPVVSLAARCALEAGIPTVLRPFGTLSRYTFGHRRGQLKRAYFALLDRPNIRRSTLHFTTDGEMLEAGWHGIPFGSRAHVVPPPFTGHEPPPRSRRPGTSGRTLLFLSRIDPVKNIEVLLDAWALLQPRAPEAILAIAGGGEPHYVATLRARAERLGVVASVRFHGFATGTVKERLLAEADAFVLPSRHENFGMAVLEAIGAGLPVVISPEVQLASFVSEHGLGRVVPARPEPLAQALLAVLGDESLRAHCHARGPRRVAEHFSPERIGERLLAMYDAARGRSRETCA